MRRIFKLLIIVIAGFLIVQNVCLAKILKPKDLKYQGAFRLPATFADEGSAETWSWGGRSAAFYPQGDPNGVKDGYPGSIFATGHNQYQYVSEISIPKPIISLDKNLSDLNFSSNLQEFYNIRENRMGELELPIFGLGYLPKQKGQNSGKLYYAWGQHMQEGEKNASHGWFNLNLSNPDVKGPWKIDNQYNYVTTGYIFSIPKDWARKNTSGKRLITGRFRDGGQGSQGPVAIAFAPWQDGNPPKIGAKLSSKTLLKYSSAYDDPDAKHALKNYSQSDQWAGGAWLRDGKKQAMIFVGIKGLGKCWYGYYDGTVWPEEPPYPNEGPDERGWWSEDFEARILFYRAKDLKKVARGKKKSYWPQPYAIKNIDKKMYYQPKNEFRYIGGVAYDQKHKLLYVFEYLGDQENNRPIAHVWNMNAE